MNTTTVHSRARFRSHFISLPLIAGVLLALLYAYREYVTDDAYITFRYLHNYLAGHGLVYNPSDFVWGYSNFLWLAVLCPAVAAGMDPLTASRIIGILCTAASIILVFRWRGTISGDRSGNVLGASLLVTSGAFVMQAMGGLETALFTLLILLAIHQYRNIHVHARHTDCILAGFFLACAAMTRPEGVFLFGLLLVNLLASKQQCALRARTISLSLGFLAPYLIYIASMYNYYGTLWPNSVDAKVGYSAEQVFRGLAYVAVFAFHYPFYPILLAIAGLWIRRGDTATRAVFLCALFLVLLSVCAGGDWMRGYRLLHTVLALVSLLVPFITFHATEYLHAGAAGFCKRHLAAAVLMLAILVNILNLKWDPHINNSGYHGYVLDGITTGKWMRSNFDPGAVVATNTGGSIAYFSQLQIVDMMGINDRVIATRSDPPEAWKGIESGDGAYVLSREPDYIQFGSSTGSIEPVHLSDIEIYRSETFWNWYELKRYEVNGAITLLIYKRRPHALENALSETARRVIEEIADARMKNSRFRY